MRTATATVLLSLLACGISWATDGTVGCPIRPLYELREHELPDLHDGSVNDWRRVLPSPTLVSSDFYQIHPETSQAPPSMPDLDVAVYLAWSAAGKVYAAFEVLDDCHYYHPDTGSWQRGAIDGLSFGIDGDASGGQFRGYWYDDSECELYPAPPACQVWRTWTMRQAQMYESAVVLSDSAAVESESFREWILDPAYTVVDGSSMGGGRSGWVLELMVTPFDDLLASGEGYWGKQSDSVASTLTPGALMGIYVSVVDRDPGDEWWEFPVYQLDRPTGHSRGPACSDNFSLFELVPASERPTAVPQTTWGAVKGH